MRVSIVNLGCKVNRVESDSIALFYERSGDELSDVEHADLVVVNTCTVTGEAEKKTRKTIRRVLRSNESARVVVTGCASAIDPGFFSALSPRISVVDKVDLMEECESLGASSRDDLVRVGERFPSRVAVKIQDGCNHACTYCIVHVARGRARSRKYAQVEQEIMGLAKAGAKEIVLAGIDLGSYRGEVDGEPFRLGGLVSRLLACLESEGFPEVRLRISSIEPRSIDEDFISVLASSNGRVCRHLHIPLQSGSDRILAEMHRPYTSQAYLALVGRIREACPWLSLTTDVIVGFPGETDEDFEDTLRVCRQAGFSKIHVFRYSPRASTPAAQRDDQIDPATKEARARMLLALSDELRHSFALTRLGCCEQLVAEQDGWAMSESYYRVRTSEDRFPSGEGTACLRSLEADDSFTI